MKKILFVLAPLAMIAAFNVSATEKTSAIPTKSVIHNNSKEKFELKEEMPKVTISGSVALYSNFCPDNNTYYTGENSPVQTKALDLKSTNIADKDTSMTRFVAGTANILFSVLGQLKNGWKYGAKLDLYAMRGETKIDKMYGLFERDNFGSFLFGNTKGPEEIFLYSGQQLLGAASGFDGSITGDMNQATGIINAIYMAGDTAKATKAVYYTPKIHGFQAGFSITPDTKHAGRSAKDWHTGESDAGNDPGVYRHEKGCEKPSGRNNMVFGLKHEYEFNSDWKYVVAGLYLVEDTQAINVNNIYTGDVNYVTKDGVVDTAKIAGATSGKIKLRNASAYQLGATVSYRSWSLGVGYLNNGKSRLPKSSEFKNADGIAVIPGGFLVNKDGDAGQAWNVGLKYQINEKWSTSACYHRITRKVTSTESSSGNLFTFTVDYKVCSGLKVFTEIDYASTKASDYACNVYNLVNYSVAKKAIKKQDTTAIIIGAKIEF